MAVFLGIGLTRDPSTLPSALVGKPAPEFTLPPLEGRDQHGFSRADLGGKPMLINVFASWCVPCRTEHPELLSVLGNLTQNYLDLGNEEKGDRKSVV